MPGLFHVRNRVKKAPQLHYEIAFLLMQCRRVCMATLSTTPSDLCFRELHFLRGGNNVAALDVAHDVLRERMRKSGKMLHGMLAMTDAITREIL